MDKDADRPMGSTMEQEVLSLGASNYVKPKKSGKLGKLVVDSQVRRSPRIKDQKMGFMQKQCKDKNCLGCNSSPPILSQNSIRKLGTSLCGLDPSDLSDSVLSKKLKLAPVGASSSGTGDGSSASAVAHDGGNDADKTTNI